MHPAWLFGIGLGCFSSIPFASFLFGGASGADVEV